MYKVFLLIITSLLFIGCGNNSPTEIENSYPLNPKVEFIDVNLSSNTLKGSLKLYETNKFYSDVVFSDINLSSNDCQLSNIQFEKNIIKNNEIVSFEANVNCSYIKDINVSFTEKANYMDTTLKTIIKTFNQIYNLNLSNSIEITNTPTKLLIIPDTITLSSGSTYNIKIFTLDENNRGISAKVILSHPIDNDNESWGTFSSYEIITDENGEGNVSFTAAENIENLKERNLSVPFSIQETGLTKMLLLIKPSVESNISTFYKIQYYLPNYVEVDNQFDLTIEIVNNTNELIEANNIEEVNLTSENHKIYFDDNSSKFTKTLNNINPISLKINSGKISGIDVIDVNVSIKEGDEYKQISTQIPVIIVSGPVSAISITPLGVEYNKNSGLFEKTYVVHAVDKYSNPVKAGTKIEVGAVVNYKIVSNSGKLIANSDNFKDTTQNFDNDLLNNTLILMPDATHNNPIYLGGWIIKDIIDSNTLQLASKFDGNTDVSNLNYVIGNERRYISCENTLAVADFDSADGTYETDEEGTAKVVLTFDPYLLGRTVSLYVNSFQDERVGISLKDIFNSNNLLFKEQNENENVDNNDGLWEKTANKDTNETGVIYVGMNGGATNTIVGNETTLLENVPVTIQILTPSICKFADDDTTIKTLNTTCSGAVRFTVHYDDNSTACKVEFTNINYEY